MKTLPIERPTLDDPIYSQKNPHQTFLLAYSVIVSVVALLGGGSGSASLSSEYGHAGVIAWAICLAVGSALAITGQFWRGHTWDALVLEGAGVLLLSLGGLIFATALSAQGGSARNVALLVSTYAIACAWRAGQCARRLHWLRSLVHEINASAELFGRPL